MLSINRK